MGTNFYLMSQDSDSDHIGKRSAAGMYCWDCGVTLCAGGEGDIHSGHSVWHDECPVCGASRADEPLEKSAVGRELGFNDEQPQPKKGVRGCASFSWDIKPDEVERIIASDKDGEAVVVDEYGREYTYEQFQAVLSECPVRRTDSIGRNFF